MTTTRDPRKQRGADARATVLEVALRLFARNGYAGVSMRDVALEVGFTQAAIYYHFFPTRSTSTGMRSTMRSSR